MITLPHFCSRSSQLANRTLVAAEERADAERRTERAASVLAAASAAAGLTNLDDAAEAVRENENENRSRGSLNAALPTPPSKVRLLTSDTRGTGMNGVSGGGGGGGGGGSGVRGVNKMSRKYLALSVDVGDDDNDGVGGGHVIDEAAFAALLSPANHASRSSGGGSGFNVATPRMSPTAAGDAHFWKPRADVSSRGSQMFDVTALSQAAATLGAATAAAPQRAPGSGSGLNVTIKVTEDVDVARFSGGGDADGKCGMQASAASGGGTGQMRRISVLATPSPHHRQSLLSPLNPLRRDGGRKPALSPSHAQMEMAAKSSTRANKAFTFALVSPASSIASAAATVDTITPLASSRPQPPTSQRASSRDSRRSFAPNDPLAHLMMAAAGN
jgi:hypothetical protein